MVLTQRSRNLCEWLGESEILEKEGLNGGLELTPSHCSKQSGNQIGHNSYIKNRGVNLNSLQDKRGYDINRFEKPWPA